MAAEAARAHAASQAELKAAEVKECHEAELAAVRSEMRERVEGLEASIDELEGLAEEEHHAAERRLGERTAEAEELRLGLEALEEEAWRRKEEEAAAAARRVGARLTRCALWIAEKASRKVRLRPLRSSRVASELYEVGGEGC